MTPARVDQERNTKSAVGEDELTMTQFEFNNLMCKYMSSPDDFEKIPPLILQARSEHLHLLVAYEDFTSKDGTHMAVIVPLEGREMILCATDYNSTMPVDFETEIAETKIEGFLEDLIESGYDGIAFAHGGQVLGIEWEDLFPGMKSRLPKAKASSHKTNTQEPASTYKTDIRGMVVNEAKPGPNDPCPCGSGKKYKKCCGRG